MVLLLGFFAVGVVCSFAVLMIWVIEQSIQASRYRELIKKQSGVPKTDSDEWIITFKMNNVIRNVIVKAKTEEDALRLALQEGVNPRGIVDISKTSGITINVK
jgi:hypothetical protein